MCSCIPSVPLFWRVKFPWAVEMERGRAFRREIREMPRQKSVDKGALFWRIQTAANPTTPKWIPCGNRDRSRTIDDFIVEFQRENPSVALVLVERRTIFGMPLIPEEKRRLAS